MGDEQQQLDVHRLLDVHHAVYTMQPATGTYTGIKSSQSAITTVRIDKPGGGGEFGGTILKSACFPCLRRVGCHKRYDVACVLVRRGGGGGGGGVGGGGGRGGGGGGGPNLFVFVGN